MKDENFAEVPLTPDSEPKSAETIAESAEETAQPDVAAPNDAAGTAETPEEELSGDSLRGKSLQDLAARFAPRADKASDPSESVTATIPLSIREQLEAWEPTPLQTEEQQEEDFSGTALLWRKKRKPLLAAVGVVAAFFCVLLVVLFSVMSGKGGAKNAGRYVCAQNGRYLLLGTLNGSEKPIDLGAVPNGETTDAQVKFSADGKYVYWLGGESMDNASLMQAEIGRLRAGSDRNASHITEVGQQVRADSWQLLRNNTVLFLSGRAGEAGVLSYFDGERTRIIDSGVTEYRLNAAGDRVVYRTFSNTICSTWLNASLERTELANEVQAVYWEDPVDEKHIYYLGRGTDQSGLWRTGVESEPVLLVDCITEMLAAEAPSDFWYLAGGIRTMTYLDLVDDPYDAAADAGMQKPELANYRQDASTGWGWFFAHYDRDSYDADMEAYEQAQRRVKLREQLSAEQTEIGQSVLHHYYANGNSDSLVEEGVLDCRVVDASAGVVLYRQTNSGSLPDAISIDQINDVSDVERWLSQFHLVGEASGLICRKGDMTFSVGSCENAVYAEKLNALIAEEPGNARTLVLYPLSGETAGTRQAIASNVLEHSFVLQGDKLYFCVAEQGQTRLYVYANGATAAWGGGIAVGTIAVYSDSSVLAQSSRTGAAGTLELLTDKSSVRLADGADWFRRLDTQTVAYLDNGTLYRYSSGDSQKVLDGVSWLWAAQSLEGTVLETGT